MENQQEKTVAGYLFTTEKDVRLAEAERKKIEYLEMRIDYAKPETILRVYEKSIQERIFKTPVGLQYLKQQQDFLLAQEGVDPDSVMPIPLYASFDGELRDKPNPARNRLRGKAAGGEKQKSGFFASVVLNILLVLAVCAMFTIALNSENPNILNYERAVRDKYASWEQELTQREQTIREKERELRISQ